MQATSTSSFSNFHIMEFLGLMAATPRRTARPTAVACGRPPRHRPYARCPSFILDLYFMFTIVLKKDDAAATILLQDYSTHTTRGSCCELQGDDNERTGSASSWRTPRTQLGEGRPRPTPTRTSSSLPAATWLGLFGMAFAP